MRTRLLLPALFFILYSVALTAQNTLSDMCRTCSFQARSTGKTHGLVYALQVKNNGDKPIRFLLGPLYIPGEHGHQPYVIPDPSPVELTPGASHLFDLHGYCQDVHLQPMKTGQSTPPGSWQVNESSTFATWRIRHAFYTLLHDEKLPDLIYQYPHLHDQIIQQAIWLFNDRESQNHYDYDTYLEEFSEQLDGQEIVLADGQFTRLAETIWQIMNQTLSEAESLPGETELLGSFNVHDQHFLLSPSIAYPLLYDAVKTHWQEEEYIFTWESLYPDITVDTMTGLWQLTLPEEAFESGAFLVDGYLNDLRGQTQYQATLVAVEAPTLLFDVPDQLPAGYYEYAVSVTSPDGEKRQWASYAPGGTPEPVLTLEDPGNQALYDFDMSIMATVTEGDVRRARRRADRIGDDIDEEEENIEEHRDEIWRLLDSLRNQRQRENDLQRIDRILEGIPNAYGWRIEDMLDSLQRIRDRQGEKPDTAALQDAIDKARERLEDCLDRVAELKQQKADQEAERDQLKAEQDAILEEVHELFTQNGWDGRHGYHEDGRYWWGYVGDESVGNFFGAPYYQEIMDKRRELRQKNRRYQEILETLEELPDEIAEAEAECERLAEALEEAQRKKEEGIAYHDAEAELEEYCRQIRELIDILKDFCEENPGICANLRPRLEEILEICPGDRDEWDDFFRDLTRLIDMKKTAESEVGEDIEDIEEEIEEHEEDIEEAEDNIDDLEDDQRDAAREADRLQRELDRARAQAAAEARARAERQRREQARREAERERYEDLIRRARQGGDAGEEALKKLVQEMGLSVLDEVSGELKLGKMIGGILTIANMPDCVCPLLVALKNAIVASRHPGQRGFVDVYANEYIRAWKDCAGLPSISSVMEGSVQLADAINGMSNEQSQRAITALSKAIRMRNCRE